VQVVSDQLERYEDALDHIWRVCGQSVQMSKRTYWIQARARSALDGDEKWREFDYPRNRQRQRENLRAKLRDLEGNVAASAGLKCPNTGCNDTGCIDRQVGDDDWEQEQCEFCWCVDDSIFNRGLAKEPADGR
jgi:hypothetical protein